MTARDDIAVGSGDHPGLADEGTTAEVEAVAVLQGHLPGPGAWHCVLSIDNPLVEVQRRFDGRNAAAWPLGW